MKQRGRPPKYTDATRICIRTQGRARLQTNSARRAIIDVMVDHGGCMTFGELDAFFRFEIRAKVIALVTAGWLEVVG